jgi:thioesterase domain-containing protein
MIAAGLKSPPDRRTEKSILALKRAAEESENPKTLENIERGLFKCLRALKNIRIAIGPDDDIEAFIAVHEGAMARIKDAESWDDVARAVDEFQIFCNAIATGAAI